MNRRMFTTTALLLAVMICAGGAAQAQLDIEVFTFEVVEEDDIGNPYGGSNSATGLDGVVGGVGITEGSQAFIINNVPGANANTIVYQMSSAGVGEEETNYKAFRKAEKAMDNGADVWLSFDFGFDVSAITASFSFFQPGIFVNSDAGFSSLWFGQLLEGNIGTGTTSFPTLDPTLAGNGGTMQILDPMDTPNGDPRGVVRLVIPIDNDGSKPLNIGDGGDNVNNFFQFGMHNQGGHGLETVDWSLDRVGFIVVPEPASLALAGIGITAVLLGRRRR